ncbi:MAG: hypothetical protein ACTHJ2_05815 [Candidatus Nitrosocosmicus sp.]
MKRKISQVTKRDIRSFSKDHIRINCLLSEGSKIILKEIKKANNIN